MKIALMTLPLVLLVGCATAPRETVKVETVKVNVPVYIPCEANVPTKPDYVTQNVPSSASIYEKMQALLSDRLLSLTYEKELEGAITLCTNK